MKRDKNFYIFNVVVVLLVLISAMFTSKAQDDICPGAVGEREAYFYFDCPPFSNCMIRIVYCCFFDESKLELTVKIKQIDFLGRPEDRSPRAAWNCYLACFRYNEDEFWDMVALAIRMDLEESNNPCLPWIPECDGGNNAHILIKNLRSTCWYYENFWFTKYEPQWLLVMKPCGVMNCVHEYKICRSGNQIVLLEERKYVTAPPDCYGEEPTELPPLGKTWEEYWRTNCFVKPCVP